MLEKGGKIDTLGVGERWNTAKSDEVVGAVYKLVAVQKSKACHPKIKISENFEKITNPGRKRVWRVYNQENHAIADLLTMEDEDPNLINEFTYIDPQKTWKNNAFIGNHFKELQELVMMDGKRIVESQSLDTIRLYVKEQLDNEIWSAEQRFENPHEHYLDMSQRYYNMKLQLLEENK